MVGVSNPSIDSGRAWRFLTGILLGHLFAALALMLLLFPLNEIVDFIPLPARRTVAAMATIMLGVADLVDRTPHVWRQVPQRLYLQGLGPALLGVTYGLDMGTHVSTQKVSSLPWVTLSVAVLLGDSFEVAVALLLPAVLLPLTIAFLAYTRQTQLTNHTYWGRRGSEWRQMIRRGTGSLAIATSALIAAGASL